MTIHIKAGLIGHGIAASLTPPMHEAEGQAQGLGYSYSRLDVAEPEYSEMSLAKLLDFAQSQGFAGVNITHPYKIDAVGFAQELSPIAQDIGAINTMVFKDGKRIGHNTDYIGFRSALAAEHGLGSIQSVLLMGAGGAGGAVALALLDQGCDRLVICDPSGRRASDLAHRIAQLRPQKSVQGVMDVTSLDPKKFDGVVNATPLGMTSYPGMSIDPNVLSADAWVGDIVYFPLNTQLLNTARAGGHAVMQGRGMAIYQAVAAFELFTGTKANPDRMTQKFISLTK